MGLDFSSGIAKGLLAATVLSAVATLAGVFLSVWVDPEAANMALGGTISMIVFAGCTLIVTWPAEEDRRGR
jgi:intracellular septation protein A